MTSQLKVLEPGPRVFGSRLRVCARLWYGILGEPISLQKSSVGRTGAKVRDQAKPEQDVRRGILRARLQRN